MEKVKNVLCTILELNNDHELSTNSMLKIYSDLNTSVTKYEFIEDFLRENSDIEIVVNDIRQYVSENSSFETSIKEKQRFIGQYIKTNCPNFVIEEPGIQSKQHIKDWLIVNKDIDLNSKSLIHAGFLSIFLVN